MFYDDHTLKFILSEHSQKGDDDIYEELEEALEKVMRIQEVG